MGEGAKQSTVAAVARGTEAAAGEAPAPGAAHRRLDVFIGRWITEGQTTDGTPIRTSDVYQWMPGGFFILHPAYGRIGGTEVGGTEIIGYYSSTGTYVTHFFDSMGNATTSELTCDDDRVWRWRGESTRCTGTFSPDGKTLTAHHERTDDGGNWVPSMVVRLSRVD